MVRAASLGPIQYRLDGMPGDLAQHSSAKLSEMGVRLADLADEPDLCAQVLAFGEGEKGRGSLERIVKPQQGPAGAGQEPSISTPPVEIRRQWV
jgi:hypothetical protein